MGFIDEHTGERTDCDFMQLALEQARAAGAADEVPIGAVVVKDGRVIAAAANAREATHDPAGHAELIAIRAAARALNAWRLTGCTVYVTLEPCIMCAGLMHQARIDRCVYGAPDPKAGALGTLYAVHEDERLNHTFEVTPGICEDECAQLLKDFFRNKRKKRAAQAQQDGVLPDQAMPCGQTVPDHAQQDQITPDQVVPPDHPAPDKAQQQNQAVDHATLKQAQTQQ